MALGNFTPFTAKQVEGALFGDTAWTEANLTSTTEALDTTFDTNNASPLLDLVGDADANNPTKSYCFAKDFSESGNERSTTEVNLLGSDPVGSQCQELSRDTISKVTVEFTLVYRNTSPVGIFKDSTKCCLIKMDNSESAGTGQLHFGYNDIAVTHVGSLARNSDGLMEQKVKFDALGGQSGSDITVSQTSPAVETWLRVRQGVRRVEEIRTA